MDQIPLFPDKTADAERPASRRIDLSPDSYLWHVPSWLHATDAAFAGLHAELPWQQERVLMFGELVDQARLTAICGLSFSPESRFSRANPPAPWTSVAGRIRAAVEQACELYAPGFRATGLIANRYRGGRDSISWHCDDEAALGVDPVVASVSLGAPRRFSVRPKVGGPSVAAIDLADGDLCVMGGAMQREFAHQIAKTERDVGERISLTFRHYPER